MRNIFLFIMLVVSMSILHKKRGKITTLNHPRIV